jgi:streptogramin lyase
LVLAAASVAGQNLTTLATASNPYGVTIGPDGALYVCEIGRHVVSRVDLKTKAVTTVAGNGNSGYDGDRGPATGASLNEPYDVRFDQAGNMYFVEMKNHVVRRVDRTTKIITTVAGTGEPGFSGDGGPANQARLRQPHALLIDRDGGLLICDIGNNRIRRVDRKSGAITTWLTGPNGPRALAADPAGTYYLALREGNAVFRIDLKTKALERLAGTGESGYSGDGGPAVDARLSGPKGIAWSPDGGVYLADTESHTIRRIDLKSGVIRTVAGSGKKGEPLTRPHGVCVDSKGVVYIGDSESNLVRILTPGPE